MQVKTPLTTFILWKKINDAKFYSSPGPSTDKKTLVPSQFLLVQDEGTSAFFAPWYIIFRFNFLFKTREKWTLEEISPFIRDLTTEKTDIGALLTRHARSSLQNGIKMFNSRKPVTWTNNEVYFFSRQVSIKN